MQPHTAVWGTHFNISGVLTCDGAAVPGATVVVTRLDAGAGDFGASATVATDQQGNYSVTDTPVRTSHYEATWTGNSSCVNGSQSDIANAEVRPGVAISPWTQNGRLVIFSGQVKPAHPGARVLLQMLQGSSGKWAEAGWDTLDGQSRYSISYRRSAKGFLIFRVAFPTQDSEHVWNVSRKVRVDWS